MLRGTLGRIRTARVLGAQTRGLGPRAGTAPAPRRCRANQQGILVTPIEGGAGLPAAEKYDALIELLNGLESVLVAYSGGIDSTLLAFAAHAVLGDRCCAVLATSDTYPDTETSGARLLAAQLGFRLIEVESCELADPNFTANTSERCYHCKSELFGLLIRVAETRGLTQVVDGSNHDDLSDHRPGRRAASELGC